jgi:cupin superfamily acireductone dioxygenase involved in methionine salvage
MILMVQKGGHIFRIEHPDLGAFRLFADEPVWLKNYRSNFEGFTSRFFN